MHTPPSRPQFPRTLYSPSNMALRGLVAIFFIFGMTTFKMSTISVAEWVDKPWEWECNREQNYHTSVTQQHKNVSEFNHSNEMTYSCFSINQLIKIKINESRPTIGSHSFKTWHHSFYVVSQGNHICRRIDERCESVINDYHTPRQPIIQRQSSKWPVNHT